MSLREFPSDFPPPITRDTKKPFPLEVPVQAAETLVAPEKREIVVAGSLQKIMKIARTFKTLVAYALNMQEGDLGELTAQEKQIIAMAADATFPKDGPLPISGTEAGVPEYFAEYVKRLTPDKQKLIHLMLYFVETCPLIFGPEHTLFSLMKEENRGPAVNFSDKNWYFRRVALGSLRVILTMGYMANEEVQKAVGCVPNQNPFGLK